MTFFKNIIYIIVSTLQVLFTKMQYKYNTPPGHMVLGLIGSSVLEPEPEPNGGFLLLL